MRTGWYTFIFRFLVQFYFPIDSHQGSGRRKGIFAPSDFVYNPDEDLFICPAGEMLERRKLMKKRNHFEYSLPKKICNRCRLKPQCTRSKHGRTIKRHVRQEDLDRMLIQSQSGAARSDIRLRQSLMERSFARSKRFGYKRARWRRRWRVQIQEYLTAAIQNIIALVRYDKKQRAAAEARLAEPKPKSTPFTAHLLRLMQFAGRSLHRLTMIPLEKNDLGLELR